MFGYKGSASLKIGWEDDYTLDGLGREVGHVMHGFVLLL